MSNPGLMGSDPEQVFLELIDSGLETLARERDVFLSGAFDQIREISEEKRHLLERLESAMPTIARTPAILNAIEVLVTSSRRNEEIIKAAQQGLSHARRRIESIRKAGRGVVAYAEDGSAISSRADLLGALRSA